jgi:hypothetical protein
MTPLGHHASICNYGALVQDVGVGPVLMDGCLYDEQVPTDADGFYTIVVRPVRESRRRRRSSGTCVAQSTPTTIFLRQW